MGIFRKRPLALAVWIAAGFAMLASDLDARSKLILLSVSLGIGLVLCAVCLIRHRITPFFVTGILTAAACACLLFGSWLGLSFSSGRYLSRAGEQIRAEGYVTERKTSGANYSRFTVRLTEFDGARVQASLLLDCSYRSALQAGDRFRLTGSIRDFAHTETYDEETALHSQGLVAVLTCADYRDCTITGETVQTPFLALRRMNRSLCERLHTAIGGDAGALACALLLGNRSDLSDAVTLNFRRSGVSHLLALSGLHIAILIGILEWLLRRLRTPKAWRVAVIPPIALGYLFLTGAAVSTARAVVMVTVLSVSFLFAERYDAFTSLSVALFCILAVTPGAILDLSLRLSFCAAASIIVFMPAIQPLIGAKGWRVFPSPIARLLRGLITAVATGVFASSGILAVSVFAIGSASVFSVPLTLLLSPLVTAALFLGILVLLLPAAPVAFLARLPLSAMLRLSALAADTEQALILPTQRAEWALLVLSLVLTVAVAVLPLRRKIWVLAPVAVSAAFLATGYSGVFLPSDQSVRYTHNDAGETITVVQKRTAVAFDLTGGGALSATQKLQALTAAGCTELDDLILTHCHPQTATLLSRLSARIRIRRVRLPIPVTGQERAITERIAAEAYLHGIEVRYDTDGLAVPGTEVLWQERFPGKGVETSLGLSIRAGGETVTALSSQLVGGDGWLERYRHLPGSDVLLLLSHGRTASKEQTVRLPDSVRCVIWGDEGVAALHPVVAAPPLTYVGETDVRIR